MTRPTYLPPPGNTLLLRPMHVDDVATVTAIDRESFDLPWAESSFRYEITDSTYSHMLTLEQRSAPTNGWSRLLQRLRFAPALPATNTIVGYGGLWKIADEAHISTIAIAPPYRGRKWGELLLVAMIRRAILLEADYLVLEVRVTNEVAINLYRKYRFEMHGTKRAYYRATPERPAEDAYDMRVPDLRDPAYRAWTQEVFAALCDQHHASDSYTQPQVSTS